MSSDDVHHFLQRKNCQKYIQSSYKDEQAGGEIIEAAIAEEDEYNSLSRHGNGGDAQIYDDDASDDEDEAGVIQSGEDGDDELTP